MKTLKQKDIENEKLIMLLIGKNDLEYKVHRLEMMTRYLKNYCGTNQSLYARMIVSDAFEAWFNNHWCRANEWLILRYSLKSYRNRVKKGLKVRVSWEKLVNQYYKIHDISPNDFYPSTAVSELINKEATI